MYAFFRQPCKNKSCGEFIIYCRCYQEVEHSTNNRLWKSLGTDGMLKIIYQAIVISKINFIPGYMLFIWLSGGGGGNNIDFLKPYTWPEEIEPAQFGAKNPS